MHSLLKAVLLVLCMALAGAAPAASKDEKTPAAGKKTEKTKGDKKKDAGANKSGDKGDKNDKGEKGDKKKNQPDDGTGPINLPLDEDHDSLGLKIPYYDGNGRLQMNFMIGVARKLDPDHVRMKDMQVETFNEEGETDMIVDLPASELDLNTRVITSHTKTTIKRDDFVITGDSVVFNTVTKVGKLVGNVHMTIYDLNAETSSGDSAGAAE